MIKVTAPSLHELSRLALPPAEPIAADPACHKMAAARKPFPWSREAVLKQNNVKYLILVVGV